ncbi:caspase family protein [Streptosporangium algeriense]|uniref:Caspase family protein n=1 Tax=Streptosporangium algeriense TaxID=1682748 RepID=A0ABW3DRR6_9ACTN
MNGDIPDRSGSRAVLIGTSEYSDRNFLQLPAVANSLRGMAEVLRDPELCAWPEKQVELWEDPTDMRRLVQSLRRVAEETTGVLLVYFAGHGTITRRGQVCMILKDTDHTDTDVTGLEFERLREVLLDSPARTKIVILDCCYSGRAIEALSSTVADSTDIHGAYTLTASDYAAHVVPFDDQGGTQTSFTAELLDLVRTGVPGGPEWLTMNDLYSHLRRRLRGRGLPAPNQRGTDTAINHPFVRNRAADRSPADQPPPPPRTAPIPDTAPPLHTAPSPDTAPPSGMVPTPGTPSPPSTAPSLSTAPPPRIGRRTVLVTSVGVAAVVTVFGVAEAVRRFQDGTAGTPSPSATPTADRNVLTGHAGVVNSVAFSPDGKTLASGGADGDIRLWDTASRTTAAVLTGHAGAVNSVAFSPDWRTLASGGADGDIRLWDTANGTTITVLTGHTGAVNSVAFNISGSLLASGGADRSARLWTVASRSTAAVLVDRPAVVNVVRFGIDGSVLFTAYGDNHVRFWNVETHEKMGLLGVKMISSVNALSVNSQGIIALGNSPRDVTLWNGNGEGRQEASPLRTRTPVNALAHHPKGRTLAVGTGDGKIQLWSTETHKPVGRPLTGHTGGITSLEFSPDGATLASGSIDRTIRLWQIG